jgi:segregation and condensation protein B
MDETTAKPPAPVIRVPTTLRSLIEALIFAAQEPLTVKQIQSMYAVEGVNGDARTIEQEEITRVIEALNNEYAVAEKPYRIVGIAGGYQFATLPVYAEWLGKLYKEQSRRKLSQASTETLAIIAYRQPITKPEIESIRGVDCDYVLKTLLEKEMVTIVGRATSVGRPLLYGTTKEFLKHFGLNDIADLPRPREIQEILGENQFESERRMLEAQQGQQEKKEEDFKSRLPHIPKRKAELDDQVKIIPKKRVRDLRVEPGSTDQIVRADKKREEVPGDSGAAALAAEEHPGQNAPVVKSEDEPKAHQPLVEEIAPPSGVKIQPQGLLTSENIESQQQQQAEEREAAGEASALSMEETPVPLTPVGIEPQASVTAPEEEENPPMAEAISPAEVAAEEARTDVAPVSEQQVLPEEPVALGQVNQEGEAEFTESQAADTNRPVKSAGQVEAKIDGTAHVLPPVISEQPEPVASPESAPPASRFSSKKAAPHPKSRWQSWKEKIQGFIKNLFA